MSRKEKTAYKDLKHGILELWSANEPAVDIVAVPGLGAHPENCWASNPGEQSEFNWLRDDDGLKREFGGESSESGAVNARVLLYLSQSAWIGGIKVKASLDDLATTLLEGLKNERQHDNHRPIVFIGHSMGGLVIAKAVLAAYSNRARFPGMFEAMCGAIFFGAPFKGSRIAKVAKIIDAIASIFGLSAGSPLLELMEPENTELTSLGEEFLRLAKETSTNMELFCFFELHPTDLGKWVEKAGVWSKIKISESQVIVEKESAKLPGYESMGLGKDHSALVSFQSCKDEIYALIRGPIKRIVEKAPGQAKSRFNTVRPVDHDKVDAVRVTLEGVSVHQKYEEMRKEISLSGNKSWILQEGECIQWLNMDPASPPTQCLWISGPDGKGKSGAVLCIIGAIEEENKTRRKNCQSSPLLAYFFCGPFPGGSSVEELLKSLLLQLIYQREALVEYATQFSRTEKSTFSEAGLSVENLWLALKRMLGDELVEKVYFIVDNIHALPEGAEATKKLMKGLHDELMRAGAKGSTKIRWLFTSRESKSIKEALLAPTTLQIDLGNDKYSKQMGRQLRYHADQKISTLGKRKGYNKALSYYASSLIAKRAEDLNWINIAILRLSEIPDDTRDLKVRRHLEQIPQDMDQLLSSIWGQILDADDDGVDEIKEMLRALILCNEGPTQDELAILTGLAPDRISELVHECKPLLTTQRQKVIFVPGENVKAHLTKNSPSLLGLDHELETKWQHGVLAWRCFTYLTETFQDKKAAENTPEPTCDTAPTNGTPTAEDTKKLLRYPIKYWLNHASKATQELAERISRETDFWELDSPVRQKWLSEYEKLTRITLRGLFTTKGSTALHTAASIGYADLVTALMKRPDYNHNHENVRNAWNYTPLHLAAYLGQAENVGVLLESGKVEVDNGKEDHLMTPLAMAARAGRDVTMQKLIDNKADVNAVSCNLGPIINCAIASGNWNTVELLVDRNAALTLSKEPGSKYLPPLTMAALRSDIRMLDYLLDRYGEKLSAEDYREAFSRACEDGRPDVMEKLLPRLQPGMHSFQSDLDGAAKNAEWGCVRVLFRNEQTRQAVTWDETVIRIVKDVDVDENLGLLSEIWNYAGGALSKETLANALYLASRRKKIKTVRLFIETFKIDPNATADESYSSLTVAAQNGTSELVDILLDYRAVVDLPSGWPLQAAAAKGHIDIVNKLLAKQADVNRRIENKWFRQCTALQAACEGGYGNVVELLLSNGADPNLGGGIYGHPIVAAARLGEAKILTMLLGKRASVDVLGNLYGETALINAANSLPVSSVQELIQAGADVNYVDRDGDTALIEAARAGDAETVMELLNHGADIMHVTKGGVNALQLAWLRGDRSCMKVLIDRMSLLMRGIKEAVDAGDIAPVGHVLSNINFAALEEKALQAQTRGGVSDNDKYNLTTLTSAKPSSSEATASTDHVWNAVHNNIEPKGDSIPNLGPKLDQKQMPAGTAVKQANYEQVDNSSVSESLASTLDLQQMPPETVKQQIHDGIEKDPSIPGPTSSSLDQQQMLPEMAEKLGPDEKETPEPTVSKLKQNSTLPDALEKQAHGKKEMESPIPTLVVSTLGDPQNTTDDGGKQANSASKQQNPTPAPIRSSEVVPTSSTERGFNRGSESSKRRLVSTTFSKVKGAMTKETEGDEGTSRGSEESSGASKGIWNVKKVTDASWWR